MPTRRAALPRSVGWLASGIAVIVLALAIGWVLFVPAADWLARHDVGSATGPLLQTARDAARGRLLTLAAGLFAAGALVYTARSYSLSREGQVTDRYTKTIEQLGSDKLDVRIGAVYALERIARDSARDQPPVMEVLSAFIREHSREPWPRPEPEGAKPKRLARPDVQAAVTVIGRRNENHDIRPIDLHEADLRGGDLRGAVLRRADLHEADLAGVEVRGPTLRKAELSSANLAKADLSLADLREAVLSSANLAMADLSLADLRGAVLDKADLTGADLHSADLRRAYLIGARLTGADLAAAKLRGAVLGGPELAGVDLSLANLRGVHLYEADLTGARWPADAPVPKGWKLNAGSGVLERADTDSGPTEAN